MWFGIESKYKEKQFGQYVIEECIGEGQYGMCFSARSATGQKVVIKKFKKHNSRIILDKIAYEAVALSALENPGIPEFLGVINQKDFYGYVLEFKSGSTIKDLLFKHRHRFSEEVFFDIGLQLIRIIKYIHQRGLVHRDIRIPNVLIDGKNVSLIDFGMARWSDGSKYLYNLDYSYLGDLLLYMQYSAFQKNEKRKELPWHMELPLTCDRRLFLKRLLGLERIYESIEDIETDFIKAFSV